MSPTPIPGTWQTGDDPGHRQFVELKGSDQGFALESGASLASVTVAFETWGQLNHSATNAVLVLHALSGDSHAEGAAGPGHVSPGWWDALIGPDAPIDTDRYFVVCPNVLGGCQGTTGPSSPDTDNALYGSRFPVITIRDQVAVEVALADELGIETWAAVIGGSMGAMRALEWSVGYPDRVERAIVLAVSAAASAEQIALCSLQIRAIKSDPAFKNGDYYASGTGPSKGLSIARGLGQLSYRTENEFDVRFAREVQDGETPLHGGRYAVESYLEYQGEKLTRRFDANSYIVLSEAMNHHDVGRGRGGVAEALASVRAHVTVAGIASDRLYPLKQQLEIARLLPGEVEVTVIESEFGHDGFLLETEAVGAVVRTALRD
ncbi:MAG: homoserine O-acetyltransferase [Acidimicrobiales bacterium]